MGMGTCAAGDFNDPVMDASWYPAHIMQIEASNTIVIANAFTALVIFSPRRSTKRSTVMCPRRAITKPAAMKASQTNENLAISSVQVNGVDVTYRLKTWRMTNTSVLNSAAEARTRS